MKLRFTKMQGAGNDFVVLDGTRAPLALTPEQVQRLGDRRFGVGADQILLIERSSTPGVDFRYRIYNNTGDEVEHCGNGARCFVRYVREHGLTDKRNVRVETVNNLLELRWQDDGRVTVDMNAPIFDLAQVPFDAEGLARRDVNGFALWPLELGDGDRAEVAEKSSWGRASADRCRPGRPRGERSRLRRASCWSAPSRSARRPAMGWSRVAAGGADAYAVWKGRTSGVE